MVSVDRYLSRVFHILASFVLGGAAFVKFFSTNHTLTLSFSKWVIPFSILVVLATGIYNIVLLRPKETMGAKRTFWVNLMYAKGVLLFLIPISMFLFGKDSYQTVINDFILAVILVMIGSYARFYREENTQKRA
eukprot:TRINITY_DN3348_c0_g1_i1.p1 TRINITY_DN3348_c0_g1~~TRINITY_DN3348_c0_g1_i1.p1  ORF type:complete len:134 (-),score=9.85 TRINITY_DN3348_c0_g1_i1:151-552(-)